jgi:RNA polymerase sigma factor (sigma-70 family)
MSTLSPAAAPSAARGSLRSHRISDELLARYAARGGDRAFAILYERYYQRLYRYCRSIVRDEADAQDALQSTFTRALAALRRDQRNAPLRPWLYRVAHNESITLLRRRKRDIEQQAASEIPLVEQSADEAASARARWNLLVEDLGTLPERQRGALLLRELAGLSHEEIAVALGVSTGGAKQAIFEARQALVEVEEGRAMSCEAVRSQISEGDRRVLRGRRIRAHLRDCAGCAAFAAGMDSRRHELRAFAPGLPPAAAAVVLARSLQAASPHGGASMAGSAAGAAAVGKAAGTAVAWKTLATAAVVATAAGGATGLTHALDHHHGVASSRATTGRGLAPAERHRALATRHGVAATIAHSAHPPAVGLYYRHVGHPARTAAAVLATPSTIHARGRGRSHRAAGHHAHTPPRSAAAKRGHGSTSAPAHSRGGGAGRGAGSTHPAHGSTGTTGGSHSGGLTKAPELPRVTGNPVHTPTTTVGSVLSKGHVNGTQQ